MRVRKLILNRIVWNDCTLYGVMMTRMLQGDTSVKDMYSTCSWFKHNSPAVNSMPRDCLQDLTRLLHEVDD